MNVFYLKESTMYLCQISLKGWGLDTQRKLGDSSVAVVGAGALGTIVSALLAKSGIGKLKIITFSIIY